MKKRIYTREDVKEGLRLCEVDNDFDNCVDCPFRFEELPKCEGKLLRLARQEIIKLEKEVLNRNKNHEKKLRGLEYDERT